MRVWTLAFAAAAMGCSAIPETDTAEPVDEGAAEVSPGLTVQGAMQTTCSTSSVKGLALQIIAESNCIEPGAFSAVPSRPNLVLAGAHVFAFLEQPARDRLVAALDANPSKTLTVNSMLRTLPQQYLLWSWGQKGACGIGLAATPGASNHQTGLALDVSEYSSWKGALAARGFQWFGSADAVHFDYVGPGAVDHRGLDVLAFQRLWNRNFPNDPISEDGDWGPQTSSRIKKSPAAGFAKGASCGSPAPSSCGSFTDTCGSPFLADIEWLKEQGATSGCDPVKKLYCPQKVLTRGELAAMLTALLDLPAGPDAFDDDDGLAYEAAIDSVAAAGIAAGCGGANFCPTDAVTRGAAATMLSKAFGLPAGPDAFVDDDDSVHEPGIDALAAAGVTSGCDAVAKKYCPNSPVTREQIAAFLHGAFVASP
jgi:hypothetical protein